MTLKWPGYRLSIYSRNAVNKSFPKRPLLYVLALKEFLLGDRLGDAQPVTKELINLLKFIAFYTALGVTVPKRNRHYIYSPA